MTDRNIKVGACGRRSGFHNVPMTVVGFCDDFLGFALRAGRYFVHLPENILEDGFLGIVHRGDLLRIVGVGSGFYRIYSQYLRPHRTGAGHFQFVIGAACLCGVDLRLIIDVDLLHGLPHGLSRAAVLAGEEDAEAGTGNQPNHAENEDNCHRCPSAHCDSGDDSLCPGDSRFCGGDCRPGSALDCLDSGPCGSLDRLHRLWCRLCGTLGHLRRSGTDRWLYDDAAGPLHGASTCPHRFCGLGRMRSLHRFLRLVFSQYVPAFLHLCPCLVRISPCIRKATAPPLPELKVQLGNCVLRRALQLLSAVLLRRSLRRSSAALGSILCADSGRLQALSGNRRTVNGLNSSLNGLSCFQVCHCAPLPNRFSGSREILPVLFLRLQVPKRFFDGVAGIRRFPLRSQPVHQLRCPGSHT